MANNYTAVPHAYLEECECLSDAEFGSLIRALLRYSRDGEAAEPAGNARFFAKRVMNQEDMNRLRYEQIAERRAEAGRLGAIARWRPEERAADPGGPPDAARSPDGTQNGNCQLKDKIRPGIEEKRKVKKRKEKEKTSSFDRPKEEEKEEEAPAAHIASVGRSGEGGETCSDGPEDGGASGRYAALYADLSPEQRREKALDYARRAARMREQGLDSYAAMMAEWAACGGVSPQDVFSDIQEEET